MKQLNTKRYWGDLLRKRWQILVKVVLPGTKKATRNTNEESKSHGFLALQGVNELQGYWKKLLRGNSWWISPWEFAF